MRALVKTDPDEADRRLEATRASLNDAIRDVRAYIVGLAPENLRRAGFAHAVSGRSANSAPDAKRSSTSRSTMMPLRC